MNVRYFTGGILIYIYPSNLKARASLLFWTLRDVAITVALALLGILMITQTGSPVLLAVSAAYAFLAIRFDENSVLDFLRRAWIFVISGQQLYRWGYSS